jgi:hypothetical protein
VAEAFTQQGARARGLVVGLSLMLLVESVAIHAFLLGKPWYIHALLLAANASTIWFLVAHDRAIGTRPVLVDDAGIEVRHGMLISATVPWAKVGAVTTPSWKELPAEVARGYVKASGFDDPNVLVTLREPVRVRLAPGVGVQARVIGLRLDDPKGFLQSASARLIAV